jgi:hypothetical protein
MIWGAFPGFTYSELLNLDIRDEGFWMHEAQRKVLIEKINALSMSQMQGATPDFVRAEYARYEEALEELEGPKEKHYAKTWTEVMGKRKGKG